MVRGLGLGFGGLGFRVWLGFRAQGFRGLGLRVTKQKCLRFRVSVQDYGEPQKSWHTDDG